MKITLAAISLALLGVVACNPTPDTDQSIAGYPSCAGLSQPETCVEIEYIHQGTGWGWIVTPDGTTQQGVNFWADGSYELH